MTTVLLIVHLMIAAALVGVVLLQRSEGGALGIGGGGGGFMTGRGAANFLTRVTAGLAAAFFATSLLLTLLAGSFNRPRPIFDTPAAPASAPAKSGEQPSGAPGTGGPVAPKGGGGILEKLEKSAPAAPRVPQSK